MLTKAELQRLRALREKKHRESLGLFVVEGEKVVGELLGEGFPFVELYATPDWTLPLDKAGRALGVSTKLTRVTPDEMRRASHFPTPSSVLAVGKVARTPLAPAELKSGFTLALDGVQDAGNVGTLLRIADWFGFDRVVLSLECADVFHQKVINASMGSFARVRTHRIDLAATLQTFVREPDTPPILGCELQGEDVHALPALRDAIVVIGSEGRGLTPSVAACVTRRITIPRYGRAESLNAAVAAAIVCDQLRRLRPSA